MKLLELSQLLEIPYNRLQMSEDEFVGRHAIRRILRRFYPLFSTIQEELVEEIMRGRTKKELQDEFNIRFSRECQDTTQYQ
jgi:hypothetical protein